MQLSRWLVAAGVDLIDVSTGGNVHGASIPVAPGYQVPFAQRIRAEAHVMTAAVGLITQVDQAEAIVTSGSADLVLMARELLRHPRWPLLAASELGVAIPWPAQYERARPPRT